MHRFRAQTSKSTVSSHNNNMLKNRQDHQGSHGNELENHYAQNEIRLNLMP